MANYIDTPGTERGDFTSLSNKHVDFSIVQPFASPSKNPAENLRNAMRGMRGAPSQQNQQAVAATPRVRNPLVSRANPNGLPQKQEFTPLLKSAKRNQLLQQSILEEKENTGGIPDTPAAFRSSYASQGGALPVNSSMLEGDHTSSSINGGNDVTPVLPGGQSSSMVDSTPIPAMPGNGAGGVLDQGNVLTLRDQEAKLDQVQKDNFGLKLKIHYLEEALRKTGTAFQQATLKENVELKTAKMTIEQDLKKQRKRLAVAEHELEEYRIKFKEYQESVKNRHMSTRDDEELERLQQAVGESKRVAEEREEELEALRVRLEEADERDEELEALRARLEDAEKDEGESADLQRLREEIQDLEQDVRDRDRQLDEKDDQLEELRDQLNSAKSDTDQAQHLQQDVDEMEAELREKDEELTAKDKRIAELEDRVNSAYDREKSTKKLRGDVTELEKRVREKDQELDDSNDRYRSLEKKLQSAEAEHAARIGPLQNDLLDAQSKMADKDGEIHALQERLQTARGGWDADAKQTDARLHEKDLAIQETQSKLREKSKVIEERDDELADLQRRLRAAENAQDDSSRKQARQIQEQAERIDELQEELRVAGASSQAKLNEKDGLIQAREGEMQTLQNRLSNAQAGESADVRAKTQQIRDLEAAVKQHEATVKDQSQQITSLKARVGAMETPSKKDGLLKQQAEQVRVLQQELQNLEQSKDVELDELEQQLQNLEIKNAELEKKNEDLQKTAGDANIDRQMREQLEEDGKHHQDEINVLTAKIEELEADAEMAADDHHAEIENFRTEMEARAKNVNGDDVKIQDRLESLTRDIKAEHAETVQALEDEIFVLESSLEEAQALRTTLEIRITELEQEVQTVQKTAKETGTPARERSELRQKLRAGDAERETLKATIKDLEADLQAAQQSRTSSTPARERNELRQQLREAEKNSTRLQERIATLEDEIADAQQDKTIAGEREDLHELVKQAKIEAEDLQIQLTDRERKLASSSRSEKELKGQLESAQADMEDFQSQMAEFETKIQTSKTKERELRAQLKDLKDAKIQLEELEAQVGERKTSSSGHARREAELRTQLREAKIEVEQLEIDAADREDQIKRLTKKEAQLRDRLKKSQSNDTIQVDLQGRLADADLDLQTLNKQLKDRDREIQISKKREADLRRKLQSLQQVAENDRTLDEKHFNKDVAGLQHKHKAEMKGLAKQIQLLRAKCTREEAFRSDLAYMKRFFLMQIKLYSDW